MVNVIAEVSNWQELGIFLGLESSDIDVISNYYEPKEYHQRLVERWFSREPERSWEKLQRALDEATKRRGSQTSNYSLPSTPASPMGTSYMCIKSALYSENPLRDEFCGVASEMKL